MTSSSDASEESGFPTEGRLLGLDFGTKRVGVAVSDNRQSIAGPLETIVRGGPQEDARRLARVIADHQILGIVVGLPVHMSGEEGGKAREARAFGQWVAEITKLPVKYWDERHSSAIAESYLLSAELSSKKRKARLDKVAAQIFLQSFLDAKDRDLPPQPM
jgi:putative Holliday junction resolvase